MITALFVAPYLLFMPGCAQKNNQDSIVIAKVGDRTIDWKLLWRSYNLEPKWGKGLTREEAHKNQLDYLIEQKLLAQEAISHGARQNSNVAGYMKSIKEKEMIKALYDERVAAKVKISDDEYRRAYQWSKKKVKFEYISTPDADHAASYLSQLKNHSVDEIRLIAPETEIKDTSPMFTFGDMEAPLEKVVFSMKLGEIRGPVRIDDEYMVVKLIDGEVEKFQSELDFAEKKSKIRKIIFDRHAAKWSDEYIRKLLKDEEIKINPAAFQALAKQFSEIIQNKESENPFPVNISTGELNKAHLNLKDIQDEILVNFGEESLTVKEFLAKLLNLPSGMRPRVKFAPQLKKAIAIVVRNRYLVKEAYKAHLDKDPDVRYEITNQQDEVLARFELKSMRESVHVEEPEIKQFMDSESFTKINQRLGREINEEEIRDLLADFKFSQKRAVVVESLITAYSVTVDSAQFRAKIIEPNKLIQHDPIKFVYQDRFN
jgi:hypothetical protein